MISSARASTAGRLRFSPDCADEGGKHDDGGTCETSSRHPAFLDVSAGDYHGIG